MIKDKKKLQDARKGTKDEEMVWAPPRSKLDRLDAEEARSAERSAWRLEPEGEQEVQEIMFVSDAFESTNVEFDGKSPRRAGRSKNI